MRTRTLSIFEQLSEKKIVNRRDLGTHTVLMNSDT